LLGLIGQSLLTGENKRRKICDYPSEINNDFLGESSSLPLGTTNSDGLPDTFFEWFDEPLEYI